MKDTVKHWPYMNVGAIFVYNGQKYRLHRNHPLGTVDALNKYGELVRITGLPMVLRNPSARTSRAARMNKLRAGVAKAAAGSAYNKAKRRPRKLNYIARGTSLAASSAFKKLAAKLKLNPIAPTKASVERLRRVLDRMGFHALKKYRPGDPFFDSTIRAVNAFNMGDYRAVIRALRDAKLGATIRTLIPGRRI